MLMTRPRPRERLGRAVGPADGVQGPGDGDVVGYVELGRTEGARMVTGEARPDGLDRGFYLAPTVVDRVSNDMRIAREIPSGGYKASGIGRQNNLEGLDAFVELRAVHMTTQQAAALGYR
jgi:acyl-CoA reductase-like NAD-dependent aldehyde dehydrogenase